MANEDARKLNVKKINELDDDGTLAAYEMVKAVIQEENHWIDRRTNWFITFNSFLFASCAIVITASSKDGDLLFRETTLISYLLILSFVGLVSSVSALISIRAATNALKAAKDFWVDRFEPEFTVEEGKFLGDRCITSGKRHDINKPLLYVKGAGPRRGIARLGRSFSLSLPVLVSFVWFVILLASIQGIHSRFF